MDGRERKKFSPFDTDGLPSELLAQLQVKHGKIEHHLLDVLKAGGGTLNLSEILIGLYRVHGLIKDRVYVYGVLYRMHRQGLIGMTKRKSEFVLIKEN